MTKSRDIARMLGKTEVANTANVSLVFGSVIDSSGVDTIARNAGQGVNYYTTLDSLPTTSLTAGDQAFVAANNRLYVSNGNGWYNVSLINLSPRFDSDVNSTFTIADSATALIVTNPASDSDNPDAIITYGGTLSDSGQHLIVLTRDSSVWTFTPRSADSVYNNVTLGNIPDSNGGDFTYTFTASDGVNQASKQVTITYTGLAAAVWQGTNYGFVAGGDAGSYASVNVMEKYSFASDGNATDVGDLNTSRSHVAGGSSPTHGYAMGGNTSGSGINGPYIQSIEKFSVTSDANATAITATLTANRTTANSGEVSDASHANIYVGGGATGSTAPATAAPPDAATIATIDKFDVSSDTTNATDQGDLSEAKFNLAGHSSSTHGYFSGGGPTFSTFTNAIEKFPFAATANVSDVGDLTVAKREGGGTSSTTHGYHIGAVAPNPQINVMEKFSFASDANASDIGDTNQVTASDLTTSSSTTHGYMAGTGYINPYIEKHSFTSDTNGTAVGSLTRNLYGRGAGAHN